MRTVNVHATINKELGAKRAKIGPTSDVDKISPKCIHNMCFSEINTVSYYVHLIPHSGPTKSGNEKH